jgi:hypothetical protein
MLPENMTISYIGCTENRGKSKKYSYIKIVGLQGSGSGFK